MRRVAAFALRSGVAVALLAWVFSRADPGEALAEMARVPGWIYPLVLTLFLMNTVIYAARIVALFPPPRPPIAQIFRASLVGNFAGVALPSGAGEAVKVVCMAPWTGGPERALAAVAGARSLELIVWGGLVVWAAIAVLPGTLPAVVAPAWAAALALIVLGATVASGLRYGDALVGWIPGRIGGFLQHTARRARDLGADPMRVAASLLLVLPFAAVNCGVVWAILRAYGIEVSYPAILGLIPAMDVLIAAPISFAGLGVREGVFVYALEPWGAAPSVALAVAFTRWSGDLGRAVIGGVLFASGRRVSERRESAV